ncbi:hypothetical protein FA95DRAFT_321526 [Auriscalpium vulgare]|uniref:Uncharacterized protein n=1 Tax=Auriscalpium vulgare TaxID=40419 RepID=A0ACB8S469_9AGAM|nr:hypothetical protein FA95DRAFT_321526 [Auriscalpium vulgare]
MEEGWKGVKRAWVTGCLAQDREVVQQTGRGHVIPAPSAPSPSDPLSPPPRTGTRRTLPSPRSQPQPNLIPSYPTPFDPSFLPYPASSRPHPPPIPVPLSPRRLSRARPGDAPGRAASRRRPARCQGPATVHLTGPWMPPPPSYVFARVRPVTSWEFPPAFHIPPHIRPRTGDTRAAGRPFPSLPDAHGPADPAPPSEAPRGSPPSARARRRWRRRRAT